MAQDETQRLSVGALREQLTSDSEKPGVLHTLRTQLTGNRDYPPPVRVKEPRHALLEPTPPPEGKEVAFILEALDALEIVFRNATLQEIVNQRQQLRLLFEKLQFAVEQNEKLPFLLEKNQLASKLESTFLRTLETIDAFMHKYMEIEKPDADPDYEGEIDIWHPQYVTVMNYKAAVADAQFALFSAKDAVLTDEEKQQGMQETIRQIIENLFDSKGRNRAKLAEILKHPKLTKSAYFFAALELTPDLMGISNKWLKGEVTTDESIDDYSLAGLTFIYTPFLEGIEVAFETMPLKTIDDGIFYVLDGLVAVQLVQDRYNQEFVQEVAVKISKVVDALVQKTAEISPRNPTHHGAEYLVSIIALGSRFSPELYKNQTVETFLMKLFEKKVVFFPKELGHLVKRFEQLADRLEFSQLQKIIQEYKQTR